SGHGEVGADGGLLFLSDDATMNGTELAQVLSRCRVKLAVFNSCWGAQPDETQQKAMPRSSLAEVLLHHGVPAVLAMRDSIEDREALSFIQVFARTLAEGASIDRAVAIARQHLLTEYKFNWPAWTLPVLYMHPQFDGELIKPLDENRTVIPFQDGRDAPTPTATLRSLVSPAQVWRIRNGIMRIGRLDDNDLVLREDGVSRNHATIVYRTAGNGSQPAYFLRDRSTFGTYVASSSGWHLVHDREVPLRSNMQLKFGSEHNPPLEFVVDDSAN
ncbi:MAG: FHA domain-containing protein, partial [Microcoleus sp. SIO2G3]|nr:FHA domain-containing protein [Microcoleus sp. SIO2G3]